MSSLLNHNPMNASQHSSDIQTTPLYPNSSALDSTPSGPLFAQKSLSLNDNFAPADQNLKFLQSFLDQPAPPPTFDNNTKEGTKLTFQKRFENMMRYAAFCDQMHKNKAKYLLGKDTNTGTISDNSKIIQKKKSPTKKPNLKKVSPVFANIDPTHCHVQSDSFTKAIGLSRNENIMRNEDTTKSEDSAHTESTGLTQDTLRDDKAIKCQSIRPAMNASQPEVVVHKDPVEEKKLTRMIKNRISAQVSRDKKRIQLEQYAATNKVLTGQYQTIVAERNMLFTTAEKLKLDCMSLMERNEQLKHWIQDNSTKD